MEEKARKLYERITKLLIERKLTITTMESATGGQIASLITDTEGASSVLKGAFICYSNDAKIANGVPAEVIEEFGVYSIETAEAMAEAAYEMYDADISIGITGSFANVDPNNDDSVPGEVYVVILYGEDAVGLFIEVPTDISRFESKMYIAEEVGEQILAILSLE